MNRFLFFVFFAVLSVSLTAGETARTANLPQAGETMPWHDPSAAFRVEFEQEKSDNFAIFDDRRICLPATLENGVRIFDADGNEIPSHACETGGVFLAPASQTEMRFLYFGYHEKQKNHDLKDVPLNGRLLRGASWRNIVSDPEDWHEFETKQRKEWMERNARNFKFPSPCDPQKCTRGQSLYHQCHNAFLPFCARNVFFTHGKDKSRLWLEDPTLGFLTFCCRGLRVRMDYPLFAGHGICEAEATKNALFNYHLQTLQKEKEIEKIQATDSRDGLEKQLIDAAVDVPANAPETSVLSASAGLRNLLYFKGRLLVTEKGIHRFRVDANATRILNVDGKRILRKFGTEYKENEPLEIAEIDLEPGLHDFLLCYQKKDIGTWVSCSWKRPSDTEFRLLSETNFSPGIPVALKALRSVSGLTYPLVLRSDEFRLYAGKRETLAVQTFTSASETQKPLLFQFNGRNFEGEQQMFFTPAGRDVPPGVLVSSAETNAILEIAEHPHLPERLPVAADIRINLFLPMMIYDDETLSGTVELFSRFPIPVTADFDENGTARKIVIPSPLQKDGGRFTPGFSWKDSFPLRGAEMKNEERKYGVSVSGFSFDSTAFRVLDTDSEENFEFQNGAFRTSDGKSAILLLHRVGLNELRKWEFARKMADGFHRPHRIFVAAEDFGSFPEKLRDALEQRDMEVVFESWTPIGSSEGSPLPESLNRISKALRESGADTVLLIPPSQARRKTHSLRDELRCMAYLIELAEKTPSVRHVAVASPVPAAGSNACPEAENAFSSELRAMKREYGFDFLELCAYLMTKDAAESGETPDEVYDPVYSPEYTDRAVRFLVKEL